MTIINSCHGELLEVVFGVPKGSVFVSLLFNVFLAELSFIANDIEITSDAIL